MPTIPPAAAIARAVRREPVERAVSNGQRSYALIVTSDLEHVKQALTDRYLVEREIGAGGMASVYLAEDRKHHRRVAIKVLRPELAAIVGAERFLKEIEVTAQFQHPNILPLYDSGRAEGGGEGGLVLYYVMPYVDGESLRERLDRDKQLGVTETVELLRDVAAALQYAHDRGIIHRDIKPENIMLQSGHALVADFGIALALSAAGGSRLTETGLSIGTPHYMSPEQATGDRQLDPRTDLYSLGAVAYEMLVGDPPHTASTMQAIVAKIVSDDPPPISRTRPVPPNVEAAIHQALAKIPPDRFAKVSFFADALVNPAFAGSSGSVLSPSRLISDPARWRGVAGGLGVLATVLGILLALVLLIPSSPPSGVTRVSLAFPADQRPLVIERPALAVSQDGRRFVYVGPGGDRQLWLRDLDRLDAVPLRGTEGGCCPAFSPDGQDVAFLTDLGELRIVSLGGGPIRTVLDSGLSDVTLYGGGVDWGRDGYLYASGPTGLFRVLPGGGGREMVAALDTTRGHRTYASPSVLPNSRGALVTVIPTTRGDDLGAYNIGVVDFADGSVDVILQGVFARYASSGHVVFVQDDGTLLAAPFDQNDLAATGPATSLAELVRAGFNGNGQLAIADNGTLVYGTGLRPVHRIGWVDRQGAFEPLSPEWTGRFGDPALSPDGTRIGVSVTTGDGQDIWIRSLTGESGARLTFAGGVHLRATWMPGSESVFFISDRTGEGALFRKPDDGGADAVPVPIVEERPVFDVAFSPDGEWIIFRTDNLAPGRGDLYALPTNGDSVPVELLATPAEEAVPALSPNGRWLAYQSDESGRREIYVRPFPNTQGSRWQVSTEGGREPLWANSGRELFYRDDNDDLIAVQVTQEPSFTSGPQRRLFSASPYLRSGFHQSYDITLDDQRFLMIREEAAEDDAGLVLVLNWFEVLNASVGN